MIQKTLKTMEKRFRENFFLNFFFDFFDLIFSPQTDPDEIIENEPKISIKTRGN